MKKLKDIVKKNPEPARGRFGVNPSDPWSAKYGIAEDLTTSNKSAGDSRSKVADSPTAQRANELKKAAKEYLGKINAKNNDYETPLCCCSLFVNDGSWTGTRHLEDRQYPFECEIYGYPPGGQ